MMIRILGRKNSSNVQKVLWLCHELDIAYEREDYGGEFGKTKDAAYLELNPNALVPTLIDDGFAVWESNTIMRYLAQKVGSDALYPTELKARSMVDRWLDWQQSVLGGAFRDMFLGLIRTPPEERDMKLIAASRDATSRAMAILDSRFVKSSYLAGDTFTIADISISPFVYRWFNMDIEREDYPHLKGWYDKITQYEGFRTYLQLPIT